MSERRPLVYPEFLASKYNLLRELGQGAYGIVRWVAFMRTIYWNVARPKAT